MNLHSYFTQQREQRLSDERKFLLYQRICEQRSSLPHSLKRTSIFTKQRVYAFLTTLIVFVFFESFFWDLPQILEYRAFFVQKDPAGFWTVSAGYIAEILEFNGDYLIEKEGKTFKNSVLFDGDLITLKDNAKIIFNINDHLKTEVQGPAKFTISQVSEGKYRLYLMEGSFLRIEGQEETDALQVETDDMMIETTKDEKVALELSKKNQKTELKNSGATLLVKNKKVNVEEKGSIKLETAKLLTIQDNDIAKITDVSHFEKVLVNKQNLTHTTKITSESSENAPSLDQLTKELEFLSEQKELEQNRQEKIFSGLQETVDSELAYRSDAKKVPTEVQLGQITAALNRTFLLSDFQDLYIAKQGNDIEAINNAYRTLSWRIKSIGDSYNINIKIGTTSDIIISELQKLKKGLEEYHIPPTKLQQLDIMKDRVIHMQSFVPTELWEDYKQHLPVHLQFK